MISNKSEMKEEMNGDNFQRCGAETNAHDSVFSIVTDPNPTPILTLFRFYAFIPSFVEHFFLTFLQKTF